jgi:hypothetical protein
MSTTAATTAAAAEQPIPGSENQDALQAPSPQQQQPLTVQQILVKLIIDGQNNVNRLVSSLERLTTIQEQQMIYINMLIKNVNSNESTATSTVPTPPSEPSTTVQTQSGVLKTAE